MTPEPPTAAGAEVAAVRLRHVTVRRDGVTALRDVSLTLDARTTAVIGENGSGKSTFARLVSGLVRPVSGDVRVLGLNPAQDADALRRRVAVVFSNPDAQIIMPTVAEDVRFSLRTPRRRGRRGASRDAGRRAWRTPESADAAARVTAALERFGLAQLADRPSYGLSGGQKQLLALAGAFVRRPDLVVADEPTAALDARNARRVADHLLAGAGHRLVLVTHDLALAARCQQAVLFADGRLQAVGAAAAVIARYEAVLAC